VRAERTEEQALKSGFVFTCLLEIGRDGGTKEDLVIVVDGWGESKKCGWWDDWKRKRYMDLCEPTMAWLSRRNYGKS
jgi:hypothetical protein